MINCMQGEYIELPCDYHTMFTFMVCYHVCLHMHYLACRRGDYMGFCHAHLMTKASVFVCECTPEITSFTLRLKSVHQKLEVFH